MSQDEALHSPCVRMCTLDDDDICLGCGRSLEEIKGWAGYSEDTRTRLLLECKRRLAARCRFSNW
ncbi:DUF1289 domain-containing protein [Sedimenticola hydrogenitrophicus]|uniref:DUF1289 domain-containing protein n=1 Tax=Sedimenticola hydrogenitrophicus TaxID=2967975 RepID=UPI0021A8D808|nr:DUF1289 domain-containing protein [Sedimenticola hydrogenitrophicus]